VILSGRRHVLLTLFVVQERAARPYLVGGTLGQEIDQGPSV